MHKPSRAPGLSRAVDLARSFSLCSPHGSMSLKSLFATFGRTPVLALRMWNLEELYKISRECPQLTSSWGEEAGCFVGTRFCGYLRCSDRSLFDIHGVCEDVVREEVSEVMEAADVEMTFSRTATEAMPLWKRAWGKTRHLHISPCAVTSERWACTTCHDSDRISGPFPTPTPKSLPPPSCPQCFTSALSCEQIGSSAWSFRYNSGSFSSPSPLIARLGASSTTQDRFSTRHPQLS